MDCGYRRRPRLTVVVCMFVNIDWLQDRYDSSIGAPRMGTGIIVPSIDLCVVDPSVHNMARVIGDNACGVWFTAWSFVGSCVDTEMATKIEHRPSQHGPSRGPSISTPSH